MLLSALIGVLCVQSAAAVAHSLRYLHTAISGSVDFPEFTIVGLVDGEEFVRYDSSSRELIPRTGWIQEAEAAGYWQEQSRVALSNQQVFSNSVQTAMLRFNHSGGVHTLQRKYGCGWDELSGATWGFDKYAYDGAHFISFDLRTLSWIAPSPEAFPTKLRWEADTQYQECLKTYFAQTCLASLKKYLRHQQRPPQGTVAPEVFVFPGSSLSGKVSFTCLATGFFPRDVLVSWRRDGQEVTEGVDDARVLPNGDRTYQMRRTLRVRPEDLNKHTYFCQVDHSSLAEGIIRTWEPDPTLKIVVGLVIGVLYVVVAMTYLLWRHAGARVMKSQRDDYIHSESRSAAT